MCYESQIRVLANNIFQAAEGHTLIKNTGGKLKTCSCRMHKIAYKIMLRIFKKTFALPTAIVEAATVFEAAQFGQLLFM